MLDVLALGNINLSVISTLCVNTQNPSEESTNLEVGIIE